LKTKATKGKVKFQKHAKGKKPRRKSQTQWYDIGKRGVAFEMKLPGKKIGKRKKKSEKDSRWT